MSIPREKRDLRTSDLCFIDVETTGSLFGFHEIIDVGVIRTTPSLERQSSWSKRIRPRHPERITERARLINGYSDDIWANESDSINEVWQAFADFVRGAVPVCHNPSFERAFITLAAREAGVNELGLDYHWIGTESLAWPSYLKGQIVEMSLEGLCDFFNLEREPDPHRAIEGARTCYAVYCKLLSTVHAMP